MPRHVMILVITARLLFLIILRLLTYNPVYIISIISIIKGKNALKSFFTFILSIAKLIIPLANSENVHIHIIKYIILCLYVLKSSRPFGNLKAS